MAHPAMTEPGISRRRREPTWWNDQHSRSWERVKDAFARDWPQAKADLSTTHGRERIPARSVSNAKDISYTAAEPALRYGYGASAYYFDHDVWDASLEAKLRDDWSEVDSDEEWKTVRLHVRRGWEHARGLRS